MNSLAFWKKRQYILNSFSLFCVLHYAVFSIQQTLLKRKLYRKIRGLVIVKGTTDFDGQRKVFQNLMPDVGSILGVIFLLALH